MLHAFRAMLFSFANMWERNKITQPWKPFKMDLFKLSLQVHTSMSLFFTCSNILSNHVCPFHKCSKLCVTQIHELFDSLLTSVCHGCRQCLAGTVSALLENNLAHQIPGNTRWLLFLEIRKKKSYDAEKFSDRGYRCVKKVLLQKYQMLHQAWKQCLCWELLHSPEVLLWIYTRSYKQHNQLLEVNLSLLH